MTFRECSVIIIVAILGIAAAIGYASSYFLGDDNKIEEACESIIEAQTGKNIDLTLSSPELIKQEQKSAEDIVEDDLVNNIS